MVIADLDEVAAAAAAQQLRREGCTVSGFCCDVSVKDQVRKGLREREAC